MGESTHYPINHLINKSKRSVTSIHPPDPPGRKRPGYGYKGHWPGLLARKAP